MIGDRLILADGSTGTALEALAPEAAAGGGLALLPLENPALVESLHKAYFDAGSDLVETATFSASARDLAHFAHDYPGGAEALSYAVNLAAAAAARRAADAASTAGEAGATGEAGAARVGAGSGRPRLIAGSIGPGDQPPSSRLHLRRTFGFLPSSDPRIGGGRG